ncbi:hypothetical protein D3C71_1593150 [compost metagenome]
MVDIGIEALFDDDMTPVTAITDLSGDAAWLHFNDTRQHAILETERSLILQKDDLVSCRKLTQSIFRLERMAGLNEAALDELAACQIVEQLDVDTAMGKDQEGLGWVVFAVPVVDQHRDGIVPSPTVSHHALALVGGERIRYVSTGKLERGIAHPLLVLPVDRLEFCIADPLGNRAEGRTCFDRLELIGIADENEFGP